LHPQNQCNRISGGDGLNQALSNTPRIKNAYKENVLMKIDAPTTHQFNARRENSKLQAIMFDV
jgi:hypothetical protein